MYSIKCVFPDSVPMIEPIKIQAKSPFFEGLWVIFNPRQLIYADGSAVPDSKLRFQVTEMEFRVSTAAFEEYTAYLMVPRGTKQSIKP